MATAVLNIAIVKIVAYVQMFTFESSSCLNDCSQEFTLALQYMHTVLTMASQIKVNNVSRNEHLHSHLLYLNFNANHRSKDINGVRNIYFHSNAAQLQTPKLDLFCACGNMFLQWVS